MRFLRAFAQLNKHACRILAAAFITCVSSSAADALCFDYGRNTRLAIYCSLNEAAGSVIDKTTERALQFRLFREGYARKADLIDATDADAKLFHFTISPLGYFSDNINDGNPHKDLKVGNLTFLRDPQFDSKNGVVVGLGLGASHRVIHGPGQYLDFGLSASQVKNSKHDLAITERSFYFCSKNHISNWWHLDSCAMGARMEKEFSKSDVSTIDLSISKLSTLGNKNYLETRFGVRHHKTQSYEQDQVFAGFDAVLQNGVYSSTSVTFGKPVKDKLTTRTAFTTSLISMAFHRPLTIKLSLSHSDGGKLLGYSRFDRSYELSASYHVFDKIIASVGFRNNNSNIDYFDSKTPTFGLSFEPLTF
jgi:hypothetical protein